MGRDLRHALRGLFQARGWTAVVLASLAVGIGANTALFSAVNGLLLKTLPVADPEGLVRLRWAGENDMVAVQSGWGHASDTTEGERVATTFSYPIFERLRASNRTLEGLFACAPTWDLSLVEGGRAQVVSGFLVSGRYFEVLGVHAAVGRVIGPDDDRPTAVPVAVLSHAFWARRFGLDPGVVGRSVRVNRTPVTIVGVLPPAFAGVQRPAGSAPDLHLPLALDPVLGEPERLSDPVNWWLQVMGRRKPGVTPEQVRGNLAGVFRAAARSGMDSYLADLSAEARSTTVNRNRRHVPRLLVDSGGRGSYDPSPTHSRQALVLAGVVALLLLIVCANVANLLLSRATTRRKEIAVRRAVGATDRHLLAQLLTEGVVLSAIGGGLGLAVAYAARRLLPFGQESAFDWRVFGFVVAVSLSAGVAFTLVPALRAARVDVLAALDLSGRGASRTRSILGRALLVGQVAVSLVLLVGAGLFLRTLENLRAVEVGFSPANVLLFSVNPGLDGYDEEQSVAVLDRIAEAVRSVPGVRSVSLSHVAFLSGSVWKSTVHIEGGGTAGGASAHMMAVSPEFFETMEIPVLAGRAFDSRDGADAPPAVLINAAAVREWYGGETPLGRRLGFSTEKRGEYQIVGVVGDVKYADVRAPAPAMLYRSLAQMPSESPRFLVRTAASPASVTPAVREAVRRVDPHLPIQHLTTQAEQIERRLSQERLFGLAYSLFGALATLLAAVGLFGLASYDVAQRTREIGIRMSLGARAPDVIRMVLRESLGLVGIGAAVGVAAALIAGRLVESLVFGVEPSDAATIALAAALLVAVASLASFLPARRAARVQPVVALRAE